jgi:hypothetical protein
LKTRSLWFWRRTIKNVLFSNYSLLLGGFGFGKVALQIFCFLLLGGSLEDQITLVLVKKGVIDCENDTQCDDDRACLDSNKLAGRKLCELPCERF